MADKLVALLGPGDGPRMFTGNMKNLVAHIAGWKDGIIRIVCDGETRELVYMEGIDHGVNYLPPTQFVQFHHEGKSKHLICILRSKPNAISSP